MNNRSMNNRSRYRIIFMGTPAFAVPSLEMIARKGHQLLALFTQPDRINRRGKGISFSPVKAYGLQNHIPVFQPESLNDKKAQAVIRGMNPDLIVVIAYGRILPKAVLDMPAFGCINVHASLLPEYRGAAPIQRVIMNSEPMTGITVMKMAEGMDTGDMILQKSFVIPPDMTAGALFDSLSRVSASALSEVLDKLPERLGRAIPQKEEEATYAEKITKDMSRIQWNQSADRLDALIRGLTPDPGAYTVFRGKRLKIHEECPSFWNSAEKPGTIISLDEGRLRVQTGRGVIDLITVQPENKKAMTAADFIHGYQVHLYDTFEN